MGEIRGAVSIFDALGGGPLTPTASNPIWSDRNSFGGSANIVSSGFGLYGDLFMSTIVHVLHYCSDTECDSDDEPSTMYS